MFESWTKSVLSLTQKPEPWAQTKAISGTVYAKEDIVIIQARKPSELRDFQTLSKLIHQQASRYPWILDQRSEWFPCSLISMNQSQSIYHRVSPVLQAISLTTLASLSSACGSETPSFSIMCAGIDIFMGIKMYVDVKMNMSTQIYICIHLSKHRCNTNVHTRIQQNVHNHAHTSTVCAYIHAHVCAYTSIRPYTCHKCLAFWLCICLVTHPLSLEGLQHTPVMWAACFYCE